MKSILITLAFLEIFVTSIAQSATLVSRANSGIYACAFHEGLFACSSNDDQVFYDQFKDVRTIIQTAYETCILNGKDVFCWPNQSKYMTQIKKISIPPASKLVGTMSSQFCATTDAGIVQCFGNVAESVKKIPADVIHPRHVLVFEYRNLACAILDRDVVCWGDDDNNLIERMNKAVKLVAEADELITDGLGVCGAFKQEIRCVDVNLEVEVFPIAQARKIWKMWNIACGISEERLKCWNIDSNKPIFPSPGASGKIQDVSMKEWDDVCVAKSDGSFFCDYKGFKNFGSGKLEKPIQYTYSRRPVDITIFNGSWHWKHVNYSGQVSEVELSFRNGQVDYSGRCPPRVQEGFTGHAEASELVNDQTGEVVSRDFSLRSVANIYWTPNYRCNHLLRVRQHPQSYSCEFQIVSQNSLKLDCAMLMWDLKRTAP